MAGGPAPPSHCPLGTTHIIPKVNELVQKYSKLLRRPIASPGSDRGLEGLTGVQAAKGTTPQALPSLLQGTKANV